MSAQHHHAAHGHDDHHGHDDGPHSTFSGYMIGFFLSIILTAIPFAVVMGDVFENRTTTVVVIAFFAVVQIIVHMIYFLHMNGKVEGGWTLMSTIFTIVFVAVTLAGTLWVMYHMNNNMMPGHNHSPTVVNPQQPAGEGHTNH
ncbi:cytochrome o ubiquinol oxidase subunit IV [Comamonas sp.]|uniref:cytochrome o ubiquinol oxidase subunit IV n=1 Tax=Comamonas sp. TaxID=34028 RepID=UPI0028A29C18|nr:cytochrome o ubiquinol oxidase subunit IV [Comamonas sp.]